MKRFIALMVAITAVCGTMEIQAAPKAPARITININNGGGKGSKAQPMPQGYERWSKYDIVDIYAAEPLPAGSIDKDCKAVPAAFVPASLRAGLYQITVTEALGSYLYATNLGNLCIRMRNIGVMRKGRTAILEWNGQSGRIYRNPSL